MTRYYAEGMVGQGHPVSETHRLLLDTAEDARQRFDAAEKEAAAGSCSVSCLTGNYG